MKITYVYKFITNFYVLERLQRVENQNFPDGVDFA